MSVGRRYAAAAAVGHAIFAGGQTASGKTDAVEAYDTSLTKTMLTALPHACACPLSASVGNYAVINACDLSSADDVYVSYDRSLTQRVETDVHPYWNAWGAAAAVGNYAIFAGGINGSLIYSKAEAFTIS